MDASAAGLILLIARRLALAVLASFICAVAVMSVGPAAAALPPPSVAVLGSAAAGRDASAVESSLGFDRAARRLIQRGLNNHGFDPGVADGLFGPRTRSAIRRWQEACRLPVAGYVDGRQPELFRVATFLLRL